MSELHPTAAAPGSPSDAVVRAAALLDQLPAIIGIFRGPELRLELANPPLRALAPGEEIVGRTLAELRRSVFRHSGLAECERQLRQVATTGSAVHGHEAAASFARAAGERPVLRHWDYAHLPLHGAGGAVEGVIVHAVEVTEQVEARGRAAASEHLYTALFQSNAVGVTITDEHEILDANDAFLDMVGYTRSDLAAGLRLADITAPGYAAADERASQQLRERGVTAPFEKEYVHRDGRRVPVLLSGTVVGTEPLRVLATVYDQTERRAVEREIAMLFERERDARFAAELASARIARLQEITARLSAARSPEQIAEVAVSQAMEDLSARCGILGAREGARLAVLHRVDLHDERPGEPELLEALAAAIDGNRLVVGRDGGLVALPLAVAGRALAGLVLSFEEERSTSEEDREFLSALAQQAAAALERAQLYANRVYVARTLQEGLLPHRLPEMEGLEAAVRYASIAGGGEVGGDFYDVFATGPGRWTFAVGDVCGKGTDAAVVTGLARHTIRSVAWLRESPAEVLDFLNLALRRHADVPSFCTVACGLVEVSPEGVAVRVAAGGHPPPLLLRTDGTVEEIDVSGTMLGVGENPHLSERHFVLEPGETLVVYTDGVTDARSPGGETFGTERLRAALASARGGSAEAVAGTVDEAVRAHHPGAPADDRAVLVLRRCGAPTS